jgi:hypothetical protein
MLALASSKHREARVRVLRASLASKIARLCWIIWLCFVDFATYERSGQKQNPELRSLSDPSQFML